MTEPAPVAYDGQCAPIYRWQLSDRLDNQTRRQLLERINNNQA